MNVYLIVGSILVLALLMWLFIKWLTREEDNENEEVISYVDDSNETEEVSAVEEIANEPIVTVEDNLNEGEK